jgi:hypothetical protein
MKRSVTALAGAAALVLVTAACGSSKAAPKADTSTTVAKTAESTTAPKAATTAAPGGAAVCPEKLVIQTDWWPELEHGGTYQLIQGDGTVDTKNFNFSGPIDPKYAVGGIKTVEVRAGGEAINFNQVTAEMYAKNEITFGYVNTDDAAKDRKAPVVGVAKTLDKNPQYIQFDPATYPNVKSFADLKATGGTILHFDGTTYVDYFVGKGYIDAKQTDPSYGGAPDKFIAANGKLIQQGFLTNELYKYENEIGWKDGKPAKLSYLLVHDSGYETYPAMMSVRTDKLKDLSPCLKLLVPKLSQAWVDFVKNPTPVTDKLIKVSDGYNNFWKLSAGLNKRGVELLASEKIAINGPEGGYCAFDTARVDKLVGILKDVLPKAKVPVDVSKVTTADLIDNSFCDKGVKL